MAENEDFLKKVYDKYLGSDYEWGDADLNPKREIQKSDEEDWEEEQAAIISTIEERLKDLQRQAAQLPKYKRPEVVDNDNFMTTTSGVNGAPSPSKDVSLNQIAMQTALGGDIGDNLFIPSANFDDQINFMLNNIIPSLIPVLVEMPSGPNTAPNGASFATELFNPGCDTEDSAIQDFESSNEEFNNLKNTLLKDSPDSTDNENDLSDDMISSLATSGAASNQADKEADTADAAAEQAAIEQYTDAVECIAKELGVLQYILALLKVINTVKKVLLLILSIVVPIVKMITFAAQCWINPPAAAQVLQMVAEKIGALLISVIGEILQMIWNLLEMDCKTQQTQKALDEINSILSGVDSTINTTKNLISFSVKQYKTNKKSLQDMYDKFTEEKEDGTRRLRLGQFGQYFDSEKWGEAGAAFEDSIATTMFGTNGFDENGINMDGIKTMLQSGMPSEIKTTINSLLNSSTDLLSNAKNIFESAGLGNTVLQATLTDMTDFLGPIKIK